MSHKPSIVKIGIQIRFPVKKNAKITMISINITGGTAVNIFEIDFINVSKLSLRGSKMNEEVLVIFFVNQSVHSASGICGISGIKIKLKIFWIEIIAILF